MMIETTELYILITVWMTLGSRSNLYEKNYCAHFLSDFSVDLDKIQTCRHILLLVKAHAKFISHDYYSMESTLLM